MTDKPLIITQPSIYEHVKFQGYMDNNIRRKFISKVYSILWTQLLFTSLFISACHIISPLHSFMISDNSYMIFILNIYIIFIHLCFMMCNPHILRYNPYNWLNLIIFTGFLTYNIGFITSYYQTNILLLSGMSTLTIFSGLTIYSVQTKIDYTVYGNALIIGLLSLIAFGFMNIFLDIEFINSIYSLLIVIIFSSFIVYDTQLIVNGKNNRYELSTHDYVMAAITLYLDIINIFVSSLDFLNGR